MGGRRSTSRTVAVLRARPVLGDGRVEQLTQREREILAVCGLQADLPARVIAQRAGCSEQTVRMVLRGLLDRKLIEPRNYLDVFQLGLSSYVLLFSLRSQDVSERRSIIDKLSALTGVAWFAEVGGDYEYVMNVCHGDIHRLISVLDRVGQDFGEVFSKKIVAQHFSYCDYSYGFLTNERNVIDYVGTSWYPARSVLDELDHSILRELAAYPLANKAVCKKLGLALTTLQYRIERLRRAGILKRAIFLINHSALGYSSALLLVYANASSKRLREQLHDFCVHHPHVITLAQSVGSWDYEISALARSPEDLRNLRDDLTRQFSGQFAMISSLPLYRILKWNQYPFTTYQEYLESVGVSYEGRITRVDNSDVEAGRQLLASNDE